MRSWLRSNWLPLLSIGVALIVVVWAWVYGSTISGKRLDALVALSPLALIIITWAALWETRRATQAAAVSAEHAATAAEAARRQADAAERAERIRTLPVLVAVQQNFVPHRPGKPARMDVTLNNVGRGTAYNARARVERDGVTSLLMEWISGPTAISVGVPSSPIRLDWPFPDAERLKEFPHLIEVRYRDEGDTEYWSSISPRGVTVQRVIHNDDGTISVTEPLVSYEGAFDLAQE